MGKKLRTNYKKVVFSLVAVSLSVGATISFNGLQAETIAQTRKDTPQVKTDVQETEVSKQSVTVGATTITYDGLCAYDDSVGNIERMKNTPVINMTFERKEGFNDAEYVSLDMQFVVNIKGKDVRLYFNDPVELKKVSETKVTVAAPITGLVQKKDDKTKRTEEQSISLEDVTLDKLEGKDVEVNINEILYIVKKDVTFNDSTDVVNFKGREALRDIKASENEKKTVSWKF